MTTLNPLLDGMRAVLHRIRHRTGRVTRIATRFNRLMIYGFDLVLWSNLIAKRRPPVPVDLTPALLETKAVRLPPPALFVSGPPSDTACWADGFAAVHAGLFLNLQNPDELSAYRYAHPAPAFRGIYLWDSAFIAQIWKWWDADVAFDILQAVIALRDGDRLQHFVSDVTESRFTQPPLLAWSLIELANAVEHHRIEPLLRELFQPLCAYQEWLKSNRRLANGLYAWAHPYESGVENTPRFSSRDERELVDTRYFAAPDFCTYVTLQYEALAAMAERLGQARTARRLLQEADALREAVNRHLWDEETGFYFDLDVRTGRLLRLRTIASLLPIWAGIPDEDQATRLRAHVTDPAQFNTLIPLPTVARDEAHFEKDMWRGPVWLNTAYAVLLGMRRYGFQREAADIAYRLCEGVYRTYEHSRRIHEFYDPERYGIEQLHRKRGNRWKKWTLGSRPVAEFVGWSGLANTLLMDVLFGLQRTAQGLALRPTFPAIAVGSAFSLRLPRERASVDIEVLPRQRVRGAARTTRGVNRFEVDFGESVEVCLPRDAFVAATGTPEGAA